MPFAPRHCLALPLLPVAAVMAGFSPAPAAATAVAAESAPRSERRFQMDVSVNGIQTGRWLILDRDGQLLAESAAFDRWQVRRRPTAIGVPVDGKTWYPLSAIQGAEIRLAFSDQRMELQVPPVGMAGTPAAAPPAPPAVSSVPMSRNASGPNNQPVQPNGPAPATAADSPSQGKASPRLIPLEVVLNGANVGNWLLLELQGQLHAPAEAFDEWRVARRAGTPFEFRNQTWYALASIPGFEARINQANQSLDLRFSAQAFAATRLTQEKEDRPPVSKAVPAAFFNYDLSYTATALRGATGTRDLGALTELGFASEAGVLTTGYVGRNLDNGNPATPANWRRLETTFTRDFPERNLTLRLGDTTTRTGLTGRGIFFGGVQIGRNFGLTPGFLTQPIPVITGTSSAPSTVELFINDALRQTSSVPAGPFTIDNFPLLTGSGQARVVVRDVLGRETVLSQSFFSHESLLEAGLHDWSVEIGAVRQNLGTRNADYGERFISGLWRYGATKAMTLETRGEWGENTRGGSLGLSVALPGQTLGQAAVSVSDDRTAGRGHQWLLGLEHSSLRHGFSLRAEAASERYRWLGGGSTPPQKQLFAASYSYSSEGFGALGLGWARAESWGQLPLDSYSLNYSRRVGTRGTMTLSATRVSGATSGTSFGVSVVLPLDDQINSGGNLSHRAGRTDAYASASKSLSTETGTGWRALAGTRGGQTVAEGGFYVQGSKSLLTADLSASSAQQTIRVGAQGGLVAMDGRVFASRTVRDSFALVEVPGYPGVGIGFQGSRLTQTDSEGIALLPRLQPYTRNSIRLDPAELPISAELESIEQVAVPPWRSGIKVSFPVRSGRAALVKIVFDDGEAAPAGAEIELIGDQKTFFVARRGEAFITGLQPRSEIRLQWNGASCRMVLELPAGGVEDIARIGPLTCDGIRR